MDLNPELIGLFALTATTLGNFYKSHQDKKSGIRKLTERDKMLTEGLRGLENEVVKVGMAMKDLKDETDFERVLKNAVRSTANQITNHSYQDDNYKNILMYVAGQTEDFALLFYYSPYRNKPAEQEKYLQAYIDEKRMKIKTFVDSASCDIKVYNGHKYILSAFLKEMNIHRHTELLALDLKRNGLSKIDIVERFTDFTNTVLDETIKAFIIYKGLDSYNINQDAA